MPRPISLSTLLVLACTIARNACAGEQVLEFRLVVKPVDVGGFGAPNVDGQVVDWASGNAIKHHLWWHRAMCHLERREFDAVLDLYDQRFQDLASPLVVAMPDFMLDVQNAASMLLRLELRGVSVGERWAELADKAEARIGDWLSPFTVPHRMMALAAARRWAAAERMLGALREAAWSDRNDRLRSWRC